MADPSQEPRKTSRRVLLKRAGAVGVAATAGGALTASSAGEVVRERIVEREGTVALTAVESETVDAICARLIPTDANGPGATEARVGRYIDWALGGGLAHFRASYEQGLAQVDAYCRAVHGARFVQLTPAQQDTVLTNLQNNTAVGFPDAQSFFNLIRGHAVQGMFGDPFHGGNANFVGWDLIGYPGVKLSGVTAQEQALDYTPVATHKAAYDFAAFKKRQSPGAKAGANHHGH
jgi:gluconate 2-dehydrogenase gamma chain